MYDLILKNGIVLDCFYPMEKKLDLAISEGKIAAVGTFCEDDGRLVLDCTDCIITPGLIDFHLHLFYRGSTLGVPADLALLPNGVTTGIDAGTSGVWNYESCQALNQFNLSNYYSFINVASTGLISDDIIEDIDPNHMDEDGIKRLVDKYAGILIGLKIKMGRASVGTLGIAPLVRAVEMGEKLSLPVIVHVTDPGAPIDEIARVLRKGDVFCHVFQGKGETIFDPDGNIREQILQARSRGVLFDSCNGNANFSLQVALDAKKQGFLSDIISSDLTSNSFYKGYAVSMPVLMSKYLAIGYSFTEIIQRTTLYPAIFLHREKELGSLLPSTVADIAVWKIEKTNTIFSDCDHVSIAGNQLVKPVLTVKDGFICYRSPEI